jgi:sporulation protein YlmC with PRC-barrel domain
MVLCVPECHTISFIPFATHSQKPLVNNCFGAVLLCGIELALLNERDVPAWLSDAHYEQRRSKMPDTTIISFDKHFKGLTVMNAETAWKVGTVADLAIDPTHGVVSGLLLTTSEQKEQFLPVRDGLIFKESFLLNRSSIPRDSPASTREQANAANEDLPEILRATSDLLGASVVTEQGQLLGNISEVYLDPADWQVFYRVTASWWQRWWGSGIYLPARATVRWSQTTSRLVVATGAEERRPISSPTKRVTA